MSHFVCDHHIHASIRHTAGFEPILVLKKRIVVLTAVMLMKVLLLCTTVAAQVGSNEQDVLPSLLPDDAPADPVGDNTPKSTSPGSVESPEVITETTDAEPSDMLDVSAAREKAIIFFRDLAATDKVDGIISPPIRTQLVVGYTDKEVRFSEKLIDAPIYEIVQEYQNVKVGEGSDAVTIRKKVNVRKVVGTEKKMAVVGDPNGNILRVIKVPIHGPGGPDAWKSFQFGHNAMAIYAMMRAGVDPSDELIQRVAGRLDSIYTEFGLPDLTWDLAWSTAAFSMLREDQYRELARRLAGKLLDGQIDKGNAAGLWGPECINTELLAAMAKKKAEYSKFYLAAKTKHATSKKEADQKKMDQAMDALQKFEKLSAQVSMLAGSMVGVGGSVTLVGETGIAQLSVPSLQSWIYNQRSADMESTAIAMFALRVATAQKVIPSESWRPLDERKRALTPPRRARDVLKKAVTAIQGAQQEQGWTELNQHQAVTDFNQLQDIPGVPLENDFFPPLNSPVTSLSIAQGYSVFLNYAAMVGVAELKPLLRNVKAGNASVKSVLAKGFADPDSKAPAASGLCFFLGEAPDLGSPELELSTSLPIAKYLLDRQNKDGSWGPNISMIKDSSSIRERRNVLPDISELKADPKPWSKPHVDYNAKTKEKHLLRRYFMDPRVEHTAYALLALASDRK